MKPTAMPDLYSRVRPQVSLLSERWTRADGAVVFDQLQILRDSIAVSSPRGKPRASIWGLDRLLAAMTLGRWRRDGEIGRGKKPPRRVAVWRAEVDQGRSGFIRDRSQRANWRGFADVERIPPKEARRRIVLLGASVARGVFYDPAFTPAQALQAMLDQIDGSYEVIDLAQTAIRPAQMLALLRDLPALQPDLLVFFGANNWQSEYYRGVVEPRDIGPLADALATSAIRYRDEITERCIGGSTEQFLRALAKTAEDLRVPAMIVVPESNLADWRDDFPPPPMPGRSTADWYRLKAEAEEACARGDWKEVDRLASRLGELDQGAAPAAWRLKARAALAMEQTAAARTLIETGKDSAGILPSGSVPRCLCSTQAALRVAAKRWGMALVDIPEVFAREGGLPGRKHFMDFCHMTAHGIGVAMRAVAEATVKTLPPREPNRRENLQLPEVSPEVDAAAHALAATYNAILNQSYEIVLHHCREALRLNPAVDQLLVAFLRSRLSSWPDWFAADIVAAAATPNARRYLTREIPAAEGRFFPHLLWEAMRELRPAQTLAGCADAIGAQTSTAHAGGRHSLIDPRHHVESSHVRRSAAYVEKDDRSHFAFICSGAREVTLELCCRAPCAAGGGRLVIRLGSRVAWEGRVENSWTAITCNVALEAGEDLARLTMEWPAVADGAQVLKDGVDALDRGVFPDIYPTFGEIASFVLIWGKGRQEQGHPTSSEMNRVAEAQPTGRDRAPASLAVSSFS